MLSCAQGSGQFAGSSGAGGGIGEFGMVLGFAEGAVIDGLIGEGVPVSDILGGLEGFSGSLSKGFIAEVAEEGNAGEVFSVFPDKVGHGIPFLVLNGDGIGDIVLEAGIVVLVGASVDDPVTLDLADILEELEGVDIVSAEGPIWSFDGEGNDIVGLRVIDAGFGHVVVVVAEVLVNWVNSIDLDPAEIALGVVWVDAGAGAEQEGGGAFGFDAGGAGGGIDADEVGKEGVGGADHTGSGLQGFGVEQEVGTIEDTTDADAEE